MLVFLRVFLGKFLIEFLQKYCQIFSHEFFCEISLNFFILISSGVFFIKDSRILAKNPLSFILKIKILFHKLFRYYSLNFCSSFSSYCKGSYFFYFFSGSLKKFFQEIPLGMVKLFF